MMSCVEKSWPWRSVSGLFLILFYFLESLTQTSCWSVKVAFHRTNFLIVCRTKTTKKAIFRNNLNIFRLKQIFAAFELYFNFLIIVKPIPFLPFFCWTNLAVLRDVYRNACGIFSKIAISLPPESNERAKASKLWNIYCIRWTFITGLW